MSDQRQVSRSRGLTAAGRIVYEQEARALAARIDVRAKCEGDDTPAACKALALEARDLARLVLRLTAHRDGATVPETGR